MIISYICKIKKFIYCSLLLLLISCNSIKNKCTYDSHIPVEPVSNIWKIIKKGHPTSYIIGSIHFGKHGSVLPINIKNIIQKSNVVVTEVEIPVNTNSVVSDVKNGGKYKEFFNSMMDYNSGKKLYDKIGYKLFNQIISYMKQHNKNNQKIPDITFMQPWAVMNVLDLYALSNFELFKGVDMLITSEAILQNKKLDFLEDIMDATERYSTIPLKYITEVLNTYIYYDNFIQKVVLEAIENYYVNGNYADTIDLLEMKDGEQFYKYMSDDEKKLYNITKHDSYHATKFWQCFSINQLISFRNKKWTDKILTLLAQDRTLIVVGLAHLFSPHGLIAILQNNGYTVTPIRYID